MMGRREGWWDEGVTEKSSDRLREPQGRRSDGRAEHGVHKRTQRCDKPAHKHSGTCEHAGQAFVRDPEKGKTVEN